MSLAIAHMMKKRKKCHGGDMAKGGDVKGVHESSHYSQKGGVSHAGAAIRQEQHEKEMGHPGNYPDISGEHKRVLHEMHEGKKHDRKYLAEGGEMDEDMLHETSADSMSPIAKGMKKAFKTPGYAKGGNVKHNINYEKGVNFEWDKGGQSQPGHYVREGNSADSAESHNRRYDVAKGLHHKMISEMSKMKKHDRKYLAEGGFVHEEEASGYEPMPCERCGHKVGHPVENQDMDQDSEDMVGHIMKARKHYSHGGRVANDSDPIADSEPAEFDELVKDDDLEFHETGENSGDELGDKQEDEDRHDIVSQIMKSRKKKDRMPRPA